MTLNFSFGGKLKALAPQDKEAIKKEIKNKINKFPKLKQGSLDIRLEQHKHKFRKIPLISTTIRAYNSLGKFIAKGYEYGLKRATNKAIEKIEIQLEKAKQRKPLIRKESKYSY